MYSANTEVHSIIKRPILDYTNVLKLRLVLRANI